METHTDGSANHRSFGGSHAPDSQHADNCEPIDTGLDPNRAGTAELAAGGVTCPLCQRTFTSKGILGRHLDRKKGDAQHPAPAVETMRGQVRRRGPNRVVSAEAPSRSADARKTAAKRYNSQPRVKAQNKLRRHTRDLSLRAQIEASRWFVDHVSGVSHTSTPADFAYLVARIVPPSLWPSLGTAPGEAELRHAVKLMAEPAHSDTSLQALLDEYATWQGLGAAEQLRAWQQGQDRALRQLRASLSEVQHAGDIIQRKQAQILETYATQEFVDNSGDDSFGNGLVNGGVERGNPE